MPPRIRDLAFDDFGHGSPPLVFVHGFPLCRRAWGRQVEAFAGGHRVIAPDLRGLGESGGVDLGEAVPMAAYAADLVELLRTLRTGPAVVVGHSMGGYVALAFARAHPELLAGLGLVATRGVADSAEAAAGRRAAAEKVRAEGAEGVAELVRGMAPKMLAGGRSDPEREEEVAALMAPSRPAGVTGALLGMAERPDLTALLGEIAAPTLVVTGADDVLISPVESERLAAAIPGAELAVVPDAGHLVAWERPGEFNRLLGEWLARTFPPPHGSAGR